MKNASILAASALMCLGSAAEALAHVSFANEPVKVGSYVAATLQVPHGCDGKATTEVDIKLPEGFIAAKPMMKPGWEIEILKGDYKNSYDNHGQKVSSGPVEVRFKNGNLPDDLFDTFVIYGKVAAGADGLAFPTVQICGADGKEAWDQIAPAGTDPHSLKSPAPVLKVAAGEAAGHDHGDHAGHDMAGMSMDHDAHSKSAATGEEVVTIGDLKISGAYARAMLPGQPVGGGFVTIQNTGKTDDRLVAIASPAAAEVQIHDMAMNNGVMTMRAMKDGIPIKAGETVELTPRGMHMMFTKVRSPFKEGDTVTVALTFEKAGQVEVTLPVLSLRAKK